MVAITGFIRPVSRKPAKPVTAKMLEDEFHRAMLDMYDRCAERGYKPIQLREAVTQYGGCVTAHRLLKASESSELLKLKALGLQSFSTEALVLQAHFRVLFSELEIEIAATRIGEGEISPPGLA